LRKKKTIEEDDEKNKYEGCSGSWISHWNFYAL